MKSSSSSACCCVVARSSSYMRPTNCKYSAPVSCSRRLVFGHNPDLALYFHGLRGKIEAEELHASRSWREQTCKHFDGGRFSCAVRSEETEELSCSNLEVDAIHRGQVSEPARQPLCVNGNFRHADSTLENENEKL